MISKNLTECSQSRWFLNYSNKFDFALVRYPRKNYAVHSKLLLNGLILVFFHPPLETLENKYNTTLGEKHIN
jgi:hypothetical protein